jgi:biopolymer transport protein ExbD
MATRTAQFLRSPLLSGLSLRRDKNKKKKKTLVAALVLTSLVDAFSILLLYLLVGGQSGTASTLNLGQQDRLPVASQSEAVDSGTVLKVQNGHYFVDGVEVAASALGQKLTEIQRSFQATTLNPTPALVIEADRKLDFALLTPIIRAGSISGFNQFKFAVLQSED